MSESHHSDSRLVVRVSGPIEVHEVPAPVTFLSLVKDFAPIVTAALAAWISWLVFHYGDEINRRQLEITKEEKEVAAASIRGKAIMDLNGASDDRVEIAAASLAELGWRMLPAVWVFLGSNDKNVRRRGVLTAAKLYEAQPDGQREFLAAATKRFDSPSSPLRIGILEVFSEISSYVPPPELDVIQQRVSSYANDLLKTDGQDNIEALKGVNEFLARVPRAAPVLVEIATAEHGGDASADAYLKLKTMIMELNTASCTTTLERLRKDIRNRIGAQEVLDWIKKNGYCKE